MSSKDLVPAGYREQSVRLTGSWGQFVEKEEEVISIVVNMVKILESSGYSSTRTIEKIVLDHRHLKGFSRTTIYHGLNDNMKNKYKSKYSNMLPMDCDLSNETFEAEFQRLTKQGLNPTIIKSIRRYKSKKDNHELEELQGTLKIDGELVPILFIIDRTSRICTGSS